MSHSTIITVSELFNTYNYKNSTESSWDASSVEYVSPSDPCFGGPERVYSVRLTLAFVRLARAAE